MPIKAPNSAMGTKIQLSAPRNGKTAGIIMIRVTRPIKPDKILSMMVR